MDNLNYGVIGNCCTAALISEKGNIEWLCFPNFDSLSILQLFWIVKKAGLLVLKFQKTITPSNRMFPIPIFFPLLLCQSKTNLR